jgi:hypothetical protein
MRSFKIRNEQEFLVYDLLTGSGIARHQVVPLLIIGTHISVELNVP